MNDIDGSMWYIVQGEIGRDLDDGVGEEQIVINIMKLTNGLVEQDSVLREIQRQKRMVVN